MLPTTTIKEARVHAIEVCGKERSLVAAGARADFDDRGAIVERIRRHEQWLELALNLLDALLGSFDF
jgi:hypothetical protein